MVSGEIVTFDLGFGPVRIGHYLHTLVTSHNTSVLHTKYWLGKDPRVIKRKMRYNGCIHRWFKRMYEKVVRYAKSWVVNEDLVRGVFVHTKQKMFVLGRLLANQASSV